jgi:hypothetical protein
VLHAIKNPDAVQGQIRSIVQTQIARFNVRQMELD